MALWKFTTNTYYDSSDATVDLGVVDGVQTYRCATIVYAMQNAASGDTITPDPASFVGSSVITITMDYDADSNFFAPNVTLDGGAFRIRLNGQTAFGFNNPFVNWTFVNVDFCLLSVGSGLLNSCTASRCRFVGMEAQNGFVVYGGACSDCLFIGACGDYAYMGATFTRCTLYGYYQQDDTAINNLGNTFTDCIVCDSSFNLSATFEDAPPVWYMEAYDAYSWESWDFHLLETSAYASGATSVVSGATVYDLDGNEREVGGARGCYEYGVVQATPLPYADITRVWQTGGTYTTDMDGTTSAATPGSSDVVYFGTDGIDLGSATFTCAKCYVAANCSVDVAGITCNEVVLEDGAEITGYGSLTWIGHTATSASVLEKFHLEPPARFTAKNCNISD